MKAVVFGGSGFLGSHVADSLTEKGYDVTIYDRIESPYLSQNQKMVVGDILDCDKINNAIQGSTYVYNFAGIADIGQAYNRPKDVVEINVLGNTNLLDSCRKHKVRRFIFASTIYVYSDLAPFYRSSKQACELFVEDYSKVYNLDFTILRYGSLYGTRSNEFNFIRNIIKQALEDGLIKRKGDGEEIRDYINVIDAARCSVEILSDNFINQYVMITGTDTIKVKDLLSMIKEIFNGEIEIEYISGENVGHYNITPYSFRPRVAKKFVSNYYHDLGQGILDVIYEVDEQSSQNFKWKEKIKRSIEK